MELKEIERQLKKYMEISLRDKRFKLLNAERCPEEIANEALEILFSVYMIKL